MAILPAKLCAPTTHIAIFVIFKTKNMALTFDEVLNALQDYNFDVDGKTFEIGW